jgi:hypothetical protein
VDSSSNERGCPHFYAFILGEFQGDEWLHDSALLARQEITGPLRWIPGREKKLIKGELWMTHKIISAFELNVHSTDWPFFSN